MHQVDLNRVVFFSKYDLMGWENLSRSEPILRSPTIAATSDINDILELYNIKQYIDNEIYLTSWTPEDLTGFKTKANEYGKIVGRFMSRLDDRNVITLYEATFRDYINSFWEVVNDQGFYKKIARYILSAILSKEPHLIHTLLTHKNIVDHFNIELRTFLLEFPKAAEILLSFYEVGANSGRNDTFIPKSLVVEDKERIISNYLDSGDVNLNYVDLIQIARNKGDFKISDKTRLKATRIAKTEKEKLFNGGGAAEISVTLSYPSGAHKVKDGYIENLAAHYYYSLDFIEQHRDPYSLFTNFKLLFEYLDGRNLISLVSKRSQRGVLESIMGVRSQHAYRTGLWFTFSDMRSLNQIASYSAILAKLNTTTESLLQYVYTNAFQNKYGFAHNARLSISSTENSFLERVRLMAPELESLLKQYKLFVEEGIIDFELLQISSLPLEIKDIPSLNPDKYIYFNESIEVMAACSNLFFSDQTLLAHVDPFKEKHYSTFFDLLVKEQVQFANYTDHQKQRLKYLMDHGFIVLDGSGIIQVTNPIRVLILKDLHDDEVASFHHYPIEFQQEAKQMKLEGIVSFGSSLFSKPEQAYFNYFLNKSQFTNGLDLRNSYLHGTQASFEEVEQHQRAYFIYLRLSGLAMLNIEDDLQMSKNASLLRNSTT